MQRSIRIAYIIDQLGTGGTEKQLKYLLEGLDRCRFEPVLFLLRGQDHHPLRPSSTKVHLLNVSSLISINGCRALFRFSKILKKGEFDIIHTFFQDATIFGVIGARLGGLSNIIVSIRDMLFWATPLRLWVFRIITSLADCLLVNSSAVKNHVEKHFTGDIIQVIFNGIPLKNGCKSKPELKKTLSEELGIDAGIPIVTLVSNCNRKVKRVDLLVEAVPIVLRKRKVCFLVIGDGHLRPQLEDRAFKLGVDAHLHFMGKRQDVDRILAGSDIAVNTSDSEGLSNSLMEAMQAGLPILASDVPGNRDLVVDNANGLLFRRGDPSDLAFKLLHLLRDEIKSTRFGINGRNLIERHFTLNQMIEKHMQLYSNLTKKDHD